jgi:osmotically-inducible protein OsmY
MCTKDVRSVNYKIKTAAGVVYVMGIARNEQERITALEQIRGISEVRKVVSFVRVEGGES